MDVVSSVDLEDLEGRVRAQRDITVLREGAALYLTLCKVLDLIAEARHLRAALNEISVALLEQMGEFE